MGIEKIYLTTPEASQRYGLAAQWFRHARVKGTGPEYVKLPGGRCQYPIATTDQFFAALTRSGTAGQVHAQRGGPGRRKKQIPAVAA